MPGMRVRMVIGLVVAVALLMGCGSVARRDRLDALPAPVRDALAASGLPPQALSAVVLDVSDGQARLAWQPTRLVNPASLSKLVTTFAALDLLGPGYRWRTAVWCDGPVRDGALEGSLVLRGSGDPTLDADRLRQLLRRVREDGVREIAGDIVLDRSAFAPPDAQPGDFDGQPLRAYNVQPDALLLAQRTLTVRVTPDPPRGVARVHRSPPHDAAGPMDVPLDTGSARCDEWLGGLSVRTAGAQVAIDGTYPAACGEREWLVADPDPTTHDARLLRALWTELGGTLQGQVREGLAPADRPPTFEWTSPPLADVVRDINKHSNNVMAEQLFLTLARVQRPAEPATPAAASDVLRAWLLARLGDDAAGARVHRGSGLSRDNRLSAAQIAGLLLRAWRDPHMPELMASLPISGVDGTLRRSRAAAGVAHVKSGSLRDVAARAGLVQSASGRRYVVVAVIHHDQAPKGRQVLDAMLQWVADDFASVSDTPTPCRRLGPNCSATAPP